MPNYVEIKFASNDLIQVERSGKDSNIITLFRQYQDYRKVSATRKLTYQMYEIEHFDSSIKHTLIHLEEDQRGPLPKG